MNIQALVPPPNIAHTREEKQVKNMHEYSKRMFNPLTYYRQLCKERVPCTVIMTNGYQMQCAIFVNYCEDAVLLEDAQGRQQMVYQHDISTVRPARPLKVDFSLNAQADTGMEKGGDWNV